MFSIYLEIISYLLSRWITFSIYANIRQDYTRPMSSMSDCEPRKESLQISMDEKKFLGDEVILNHSILDHNNLSVSANYSTFPDIDHDGGEELVMHNDKVFTVFDASLLFVLPTKLIS